MSVEHLDKWQHRPYGWRADGVVETEDRNINVTVRESEGWIEDTDVTYVMANGWTAGKNSMRIPAIEATKFKHRSVTLEYTNTGSSEALAQNVQDLVAVLDAQTSPRRSAIGLSMGGTVLTMALEQTSSPIEIATIVAPGKYILPEYYSRLRVLRQFMNESQEVAEVGRSPLAATYIGLTSVANCVRRPGAVRAELTELLSGTVHDELRRAKTQPNAPFVRFVSPINDRLLPAEAQLASIAGLPIDHVLTCEGGHGRLAYEPAMADEIFRLDSKLLATNARPGSPLDLAA